MTVIRRADRRKPLLTARNHQRTGPRQGSSAGGSGARLTVETVSPPAASLTGAQLLALVRRVASHANAQEPTTVSKRRFDAERRPAGAPDCPEASNLCRHFSSSWPDVLDLAFRGATSVRTTAVRARAKSAHEGEGVSRQTALTALAIIAARLKVRTLRPADYEEARRALLQAARGDRRRALADRLPTVGQFRPLGEWDELLVAAGLEGRPPVYKPPSVPVEDAVVRFLVAQGYLPHRKEMMRFARERGFALQDVPAGDYDTVHARVRALRSEQGLWTPPGRPPRGRKPPWLQSDDPPTADDGAPARLLRHHWTLPRVTDGLRLALRRLEPGEELNQPTLRRLAKTDRDIPAASTVTRIAKAHGTTFSALRDAVVSEQQPQPTEDRSLRPPRDGSV